ncbi:hypothetical protein L2E82_35091 [Cichorium intybus]|uniref:Uncharacterized protein n=1 Tax=Cichorium intybus TaxID=13427 RepID=A0ACB9BN73_CICIN|nr:hypothetical protein L2E82_35091 [Cichorium intybus]
MEIWALRVCLFENEKPIVCICLRRVLEDDVLDKENSRFGLTVVCGRRRDLEDAVVVKPSFCGTSSHSSDDLHFYGVYDGHGCSHVAMKCKDRMHEIVKEEVENSEKSMDWKETMVKSFSRMDKDITEWSNSASRSNCRCELQTPRCDAVVAVVTPEKIVVSNYGDSRAVLCRNGVAIPLSLDHKVLLSSPLIQDSKSNLLTKLEALTNEIRSQSPESVPAALQTDSTNFNHTDLELREAADMEVELPFMGRHV